MTPTLCLFAKCQRSSGPHGPILKPVGPKHDLSDRTVVLTINIIVKLSDRFSN